MEVSLAILNTVNCCLTDCCLYYNERQAEWNSKNVFKVHTKYFHNTHGFCECLF